MENFTTITFKKLNFTDQEFHMKSFLKDIEFQQEDPTTGIWSLLTNSNHKKSGLKIFSTGIFCTISKQELLT